MIVQLYINGYCWYLNRDTNEASESEDFEVSYNVDNTFTARELRQLREKLKHEDYKILKDEIRYVI